MRFILCGTLMPTDFETLVENLSNAGNRFLINFCTCFCQRNQLRVMSFIGIPVNKCLENEIIHARIPFQTRYFFAQGQRIRETVRYIRELRTELREADCVITYNADYAWFCVPYLTKMKRKKSWLILADYSPAASYRSIFRKIYAYIQFHVIRKYDCVIGLSENTENYLGKGQKFLRMEGGISREFHGYFNIRHQSGDGIVRFMYAGVLEQVTGVRQLLEAFVKLRNENVRLWISGKGTLKNLVEESGRQDNRIVYLGCVPYVDYMEILKKADVLINPRDMGLPENQYNFPSKILEYLATGKPVLSTKFPGWERFSEQITFCESEADDICKKMEWICLDKDRNSIMRHNDNRRFAEQFIWDRQIDRILDNL